MIHIGPREPNNRLPAAIASSQFSSKAFIGTVLNTGDISLQAREERPSSFSSLGSADGMMRPLLGRFMQPGVQNQVQNAMQAYRAGQGKLLPQPCMSIQRIAACIHINVKLLQASFSAFAWKSVALSSLQEPQKSRPAEVPHL